MSKRLDQLLANVAGVQISSDAGTPISSVAYDSRKVQPGGLFVAIKGTHVDGHAYIGQAIERGAVAVVVEEASGLTNELAVPVATVPKSLPALAPIAAAFYEQPGSELWVIGVTGTKGKSTTSDLIAQALDAGGRNSGLISTVDFKIGPRRWANDTRQSTPEALEIQAMLREMVASGCDSAVIEATSHALSARWNRLGGCGFNVAVMLNVTHEHLDFHGSFEQYRADKARLFEMLGEANKAQQWAIVNSDDPSHDYFLAAAPTTAQRLRFAIEAVAEVQAHELVVSATGSQMRVTTPWGEGQLRLRLPGRFNVYNALATLSVSLASGISLERAIGALEAVQSVRGRMEPVEEGQPFGVIVDYAHNPDSFEQVMSMLRPLVQGRMIAVFGSAGERDREKRPLQGAIAARYCELLYLTDEDPRGEDRDAIVAEIAAGAAEAGATVNEGYYCIPDRREAIAAAFAAAQVGDLVLLLGKGHEGNIIYNGYSLPWNEAAVARELLKAMGYDRSRAE
jgi:UDP-N-acetylmuramoyl-L-alanyl-D-glutamate--2,6-diaminopimelate ligase